MKFDLSESLASMKLNLCYYASRTFVALLENRCKHIKLLFRYRTNVKRYIQGYLTQCMSLDPTPRPQNHQTQQNQIELLEPQNSIQPNVIDPNRSKGRSKGVNRAIEPIKTKQKPAPADFTCLMSLDLAKVHQTARKYNVQNHTRQNMISFLISHFSS